MRSFILTALMAITFTLSATEEKKDFSDKDLTKLAEAFGHFIGKNLNNEWSEYNDRNCHPINVNLKQFAVLGYIFLYEKIKN